MSKLSTHVLDVSTGRPAAGMRLQLLTETGAGPLLEALTNADGRCDAPLLDGSALQVGRYRLRFFVGEFYRAAGLALPDPSFLEVVQIDFGIADARQSWHVPLLVTPWSYSTYRGS